MKTVRLDFCDFHPGFEKTNNFFYNFLSRYFDVRICDQPDFLIYSPFGHQHRLHGCVKIFSSQESAPPNFRECDYSFTCHRLDDARHLRLPSYVLYGAADTIVKAGEVPEQVLAAKTKFCSFVVTNQHPRKNKNRADFFQRLSRYKRVDSGGRFLNNIGGPIGGWSAGKVEFLRAYKFNIAFENRSLPGYTTEKIIEAMQARCLPIYWGNPRIHEEFNAKSFLNYFDFPSEESLIERIIELDRDDARYLDYLRQPYFHRDQPNEFYDEGRLLRQFEMIFASRIRPVAQQRRLFSFGRWVLVKRAKRRPT